MPIADTAVVGVPVVVDAHRFRVVGPARGVESVAGNEGVGPGAALDHVVAVAAGQVGVVAVTAEDQVVAALTL